MPGRVQQPTGEEKRAQLCVSIRRIFEQSGDTAASHKKNYVVLYKIHLDFAEHTEYVKKGKHEHVKLIGEKQFEDTFKETFIKVFPLKKGDPTGDRIIKFVGGYVRYINEQAIFDLQMTAPNRTKEEDEEEEEDNPASRFTARLLRWLFDGFLAKDKNVRFRVLQTVAEMIAHLGAIDEDDYNSLRSALIDRLVDKESVVRYQAVISLAKLCGTEDDSELVELPILDVLLRTMAQDESADVRKAVLINIPIGHDTLPAILDRARDTDTNIRKAVYDSVLGKNLLQEPNERVMGSTHPRALSIQQRELMVKNGLGDREQAVRAVAANLLVGWLDVADIGSGPVDNSCKGGDQDQEQWERKVLAFLNLFYLNEGEVAANALKSIFQARADIMDKIEFNDTYWTHLSPERAYLARVFIEHCKDIKQDVRLEAVLPVVTTIAFRTQEWYNILQDAEPVSRGLEDNELRRREEAIASTETIVAELLKLAVNLDYADEIGRRKMFNLVRGMLQQETLPLKLMAPCFDLLRELSAERDLIRLVVEIVQELRTDDNEDPRAIIAEGADQSLDGTQQPEQSQKSMENMTTEQQIRLDQINLRCLSLCQLMLERVDSTFEENIMLDGILKELIVPSVQRKDEIFRELGVKCLGLCCLIARRLAIQTIQVLMNMMASASHPVKIALAHSVFDIFLVHEAAILKNQGNNIEAVTTFLLHHIEHEQDPEVKAIFCKGTCKLVLAGMITDVAVVKNLIKVFVSPATVDNQELRQCLAYFLPTYSYSSPSNQKRIREIFIHVFLDICQDRKEAEEDDEIVSPQHVVDMFLYWTDPELLSKAMLARPGGRAINETEEAVQLDLGADILKTLFGKDLKVTIEKEDKKILCQLLNKLHIPDTVDDYKIYSTKLLIDHLRLRRHIKDSASNTALTKFETTIVKKFEKQLEHFSEEEFRKLEELNELFEFLDSIIPLDDDEVPDPDPPKRGRKRRSESVITSTNTEGSYHRSPPPEDRKGNRKSKRARMSSEANGENDNEGRSAMSPPKAPTRKLPRRATAVKKPIQVIVISDDEEDEAPSSKRKSKPQQSPVKEEAQLDKDICALLGNNSVATTASVQSYDSIMGPDSEGEADEVSELLGKE